MIQSPTANYYITVKFYDGNEGLKTKLRQKVLLQASVHELQMYMLKIYATGFSMAYDEKERVCISYSNLWLLLPPKLLKMTQLHQIRCGWKIFIRSGSFKESLNNWRKRQLIYLEDHENSLTRGSVEKLNAGNIASRYSDVLLPGREPIHPLAKDDTFASMCDLPKYIYI